MSSQATCHLPQPEPTSAADWDRAARRLDEVAAALFEDNYLEAMRLARIAARELQDLAGPDHPAHAQLARLCPASNSPL